MSIQDLAKLDQLGETELEAHETGHVFLLRWFKEGPWGEAARNVIWQFIFFYAILLIGFGFLYMMIRSTAQLREIRKNVAEALRAQQAKKFGVDDGGYTMGMYA
uniref:Uncharacterized protein n=1 Tax=Chlamydomonas leiostraca TaxID=1034604 RepID=A0A7S0WZ80_9CHLO|mmetsp:Transcript_34811/g.88208  ORF Transcript_34811/g.88208 Transcript_34811/m.88208 type:complete len:104 (+) Transcript_34811:156-467(+)|eukprot:CAMPEP_0202868418 /NCGR_PEP_ID=MMETSP1391-20130828/10870_1 /ASSEMBLY_ACC=CAM_ASM_000867 /TAXON_ID=1034604 /ORGANISM="Chlamydomonas leiostraca, Strain SAG 11-49" /LENGTH=103 /DNA_ID=CAMNT_0049548591 /DNA_START=140 /DNA_END=451 /DNA_ORIENTATION=-